MGKLFAAVLFAAPVAAFAIWAWLFQTAKIEARIDEREVKQDIRTIEFDKKFDESWDGKKGSPESIEAHDKKLAELKQRQADLQARKDMQTQKLDDATKAVDKELADFDKK